MFNRKCICIFLDRSLYNIFRGNYYLLYSPPEARYIYEEGCTYNIFFRVYQDSTVPAALAVQIHPLL